MLKEELCKTLRNLTMRLMDHLKQSQVIMARAEEGTNLTQSEKELIEQVKLVSDRLESSILHADSTLSMLFY